MGDVKDKGEKNPFNPFEKVYVTDNWVSMKPVNSLWIFTSNSTQEQSLKLEQTT